MPIRPHRNARYYRRGVVRSVLALEEASLNSLPGLQTLLYDGWIVRYGAGYTGRANSVTALYGSTLEIEQKIAFCEQFYQARGLKPAFRLTHHSHPDNLDALLEERGYQRGRATSVQTLSLSQNFSALNAPLHIEASPSQEWLELFFALREQNTLALPTLRAMLGNIPSPCAYATLKDEEESVAVGLAILEDGLVGLFDITTHPQRRRQGYGRALVQGLLQWGRENGAQDTFLQVMQDNLPAQSLYKSLGFQEVYTYWYRFHP